MKMTIKSMITKTAIFSALMGVSVPTVNAVMHNDNQASIVQAASKKRSSKKSSAKKSKVKSATNMVTHFTKDGKVVAKKSRKMYITKVHWFKNGNSTLPYAITQYSMQNQYFEPNKDGSWQSSTTNTIEDDQYIEGISGIYGYTYDKQTHDKYYLELRNSSAIEKILKNSDSEDMHRKLDTRAKKHILNDFKLVPAKNLKIPKQVYKTTKRIDLTDTEDYEKLDIDGYNLEKDSLVMLTGKYIMIGNTRYDEVIIQDSGFWYVSEVAYIKHSDKKYLKKTSDKYDYVALSANSKHVSNYYTIGSIKNGKMIQTAQQIKNDNYFLNEGQNNINKVKAVYNYSELNAWR